MSTFLGKRIDSVFPFSNLGEEIETRKKDRKTLSSSFHKQRGYSSVVERLFCIQKARRSILLTSTASFFACFEEGREFRG